MSLLPEEVARSRFKPAGESMIETGQLVRSFGGTCAHQWGLGLLCERCGMTMRDVQAAQALSVREMVDADIRAYTDRAVVKYRRHTLRFADPVPPAPKDPVHVVLSALPNLLLAWVLIWMRWLLPPEDPQ